MKRGGLWPTIHAERKALATDLDAISADQWSKPSLCNEWTVRDVLAHMTALAKVTPATFVPQLLSSGLSLRRLQQKNLGAALGGTPSDTLASFETILTSKHPPGVPTTMLGETLIHAEDIRRPLGIDHGYPIDAAVHAADFYKNSNLFIGAKRRIAGLRLTATDADWAHGSGPEVSGPIMVLVVAMTGRKAVLSDLAGDGVATLRGRA